MAPTSLELSRYKRLALRTTETFQGGIYALPALVPDADGDLHRAKGAVWRSLRTDLLWTEPEELAGTAGPELAVAALLTLVKKHARDLMGRPARFEVTDAAFADAFRRLLDDPEAEVQVVPALADLEATLAALTRAVDDDNGTTRFLDAPDLTPEHLRAFAHAAASCYRAAPWRALAPSDVLRVDSPDVPPEMRVVVVTSDPPGLLFFASEDDADAFVGGMDLDGIADPWSLSFDAIEELSFADVDAWPTRGLAVAGPRAYPCVYGPGDAATVPTPTQVIGLTTVLRALGATSEADYDAGAWAQRVPTGDGGVEVQLSLPRLLGAAAPDAPRPADTNWELDASVQEEREALGLLDTPPEGAPASTRAQVFAFDAMVATGRRQIQLARRALAIDPECADALRVLAIRTEDLDAALPLYRRALEAAERVRAQGPAASATAMSWNDIPARPYIRARLAIGNALDAMGRFGEARQHYEAVLDPDPHAQSFVRDLLLEALIRSGAKDDAQALVDRFTEDRRAAWAYAGALVAFWREGDSAGARRRIAAAVASNRHAVPYLLGMREIEELPETVLPGSPEEGVDVADRLIDVWEDVPGAAAWLRARAPRPARRRR